MLNNDHKDQQQPQQQPLETPKRNMLIALSEKLIGPHTKRTAPPPSSHRRQQAAPLDAGKRRRWARATVSY